MAYVALDTGGIKINISYFLIKYLSHDRQVIQWNNPCHKNHTCNNTCKASPLVSQIILINIRITPLLIATKMVSTFAETGPAFNCEMILRWTIKVRPMEDEDTTQSQCKNITATRNIHGGLKSMFSGNIFGGTFNIDVAKQSMKKNVHFLQKSIVR